MKINPLTPYYSTKNGALYVGDALEVLSSMDSESVNCVVTSPPYWGLRDYGTAVWEGGDVACDHKKTSLYGSASTLRSDGRAHKGPYDGEKGTVESVTPFKDVCGKCGARRIDNQIGLEKTPEEYVEKMVAVFREVKRVLLEDGTVWLNLGDSYIANGSGQAPQTKSHAGSGFSGPNRNKMTGLKPKDLCGIPWRVAFALQSDGWYLRQDLIWHKPNPMPESVTDRCTKAHEYIFLLSKSAKYFYDAEAIKEPANGWHNSKFQTGKTGEHQLGRAQKNRPSALKGSFNGKTEVMAATGQNAFRAVTETRNKRSVFSCPAIFSKMRDDLTEEQKKRLVAELIKRGMI